MLYVPTDGFVIKITFGFKCKQNSMGRTISSCLTRYLHKTYVAKCLGSRTTSGSILLSCESLRFTFSSESKQDCFGEEEQRNVLSWGSFSVFWFIRTSLYVNAGIFINFLFDNNLQATIFGDTFFIRFREAAKNGVTGESEKLFLRILFFSSEMCFLELKWKRSRNFHVMKRNEHRARHDK